MPQSLLWTHREGRLLRCLVDVVGIERPEELLDCSRKTWNRIVCKGNPTDKLRRSYLGGFGEICSRAGLFLEENDDAARGLLLYDALREQSRFLSLLTRVHEGKTGAFKTDRKVLIVDEAVSSAILELENAPEVSPLLSLGALARREPPRMLSTQVHPDFKDEIPWLGQEGSLKEFNHFFQIVVAITRDESLLAYRRSEQQIQRGPTMGWACLWASSFDHLAFPHPSPLVEWSLWPGELRRAGMVDLLADLLAYKIDLKPVLEKSTARPLGILSRDERKTRNRVYSMLVAELRLDGLTRTELEAWELRRSDTPTPVPAKFFAMAGIEAPTLFRSEVKGPPRFNVLDMLVHERLAAGERRLGHVWKPAPEHLGPNESAWFVDHDWLA